MKLSCYLIVQDEAKRLARTLEAAKQVADEIVIVDSGSTDGTLDIARRYTDKVIHHDWVSYAHQKNFAQDQCANDWVLSLDGDEVLSDALIAEINAIKKTGAAYPAYNMRIADVLPGRTKPRPWAKTYNIIRLYHRAHATMHADLLTEDRITMTQEAPVGQLAAPCHHYSYVKLSQSIAKLNKYTDDNVETAVKKKRYSTLRLFTEFPYQFVRYYFLRGYFLDGLFGLYLGVNVAFFRWVKIAKVIEAQRMNDAQN
ncbi:MAG: glycosyltransferase family 2 protein [Alphaproteobacteria bacterium]|nr:glycosyltransferase family 2 protein [Alphaproteobacteria bacterium]